MWSCNLPLSYKNKNMNQPRFLDCEVKERVLTMEGKFTLSLLMTQSKMYHFILF